MAGFIARVNYRDYYIDMNHLYAEALAMRRAGKSYNEIRKKLGIAKSTLSTWFKGLPLSKSATERLKGRVAAGSALGLIRRNRAQTALARKRALRIRRGAAKDIAGRAALSPLLTACLVMYWAEGYKRPRKRDGREVSNHPISFTNSDPDMAKCFCDFLRLEMGISREKIKAHARIFDHIAHSQAVAYWGRVTGIPPENFLRSTAIVSSASKRSRPFDRLPYGTVQIYVSDSGQFHRLMGWLDGYKRYLLKSRKKAMVYGRLGSSVGRASA